MGFRLEGNSPGANLYNLMQSLDETRLELEDHLKAAIQSTLGHSIDVLKNEPDLLRQLLSDHDEEKREQAVYFLHKFDQNLPDFEQIFRRLALSDPAPCVQSAAITALGELGIHRHRHEIVILLHDILNDVHEKPSVRNSAYWALDCIYMATRKDIWSSEGFKSITDLLEITRDDAEFVEERIDRDMIRWLIEHDLDDHPDL